MTETLRTALTAAATRLAQAGVPDPTRDARWLLAEALGVERARLTLMLSEPMPQRAARAFGDMIDRRFRREPVSHILGQREFWGRSFRVTPDVLDPRAETELIVELALIGPRPARILDLGTGSGILAITLALELPGAAVVGVDISDAALAVAADNAAALQAQVEFLQGDWLAPVTGRFDLIVGNPPYISEAEMAELTPEVRHWEPHLALTPGGDGLDAYRRIAAGLGDHLAPGGRALFEIGWQQGEAVQALFADHGFPATRIHRDLGGRDRVIEVWI